MRVDIIKNRVKELAFTQKGLADRIGVHPNTLHNFLNGRSEIGSEKLYKLLEILDLKFETLMRSAG